ncbi:hypothetical protein RvY_12211 [Ramazzottius varieornatus]|uniref:Uncharacterized protein n=1 Tax=Ramazzottius varieornatus TaxID=947166 RepID=A0A1D1VIQ1_RAMVA|nr:hypothetical protein RvY_12211 [Ramazzottius varieornatus]
MSGLITGFPIGFPLGPPFGFSLGLSAGTPLLGTLAQPRFTVDEWLILQGMTANQLATAATQPAVLSISPGALAIQPSSRPAFASLEPAPTMHQREIDEQSEEEKPQIVAEYNRTKARVDTLDQLTGNY